MRTGQTLFSIHFGGPCQNKRIWSLKPWNLSKPHSLSGPNRAMPPRCEMRFESRTPKSLAMRKLSFFILRCESPLRWSEFKGKEPQKLPRKFCDVGLRCEKSACFLWSSNAKCLRFGLPLRFGLRCERQRCQIASDAGRAMRTTKQSHSGGDYTVSLSLSLCFLCWCMSSVYCPIHKNYRPEVYYFGVILGN